MITPELIAYIKTEREKGTVDPVIRSNLKQNGWLDNDVNEAFSVFNSGTITTSVPKPSPQGIELKKHRERVKWATFSFLVGLDIIIIIWYKLAANVFGVFGLSPLSIVIRLLVIYLIASYSAREATINQSTGTAVAAGIGKVIGTVIVTIVVIFGIFFAGCMFIAFSSSWR